MKTNDQADANVIVKPEYTWKEQVNFSSPSYHIKRSRKSINYHYLSYDRGFLHRK